MTAFDQAWRVLKALDDQQLYDATNINNEFIPLEDTQPRGAISNIGLPY